MAKPVQAAMQEMMDDGTYAKILDYWGISARRDQDIRDQPAERAGVLTG